MPLVVSTTAKIPLLFDSNWPVGGRLFSKRSSRSTVGWNCRKSTHSIRWHESLSHKLRSEWVSGAEWMNAASAFSEASSAKRMSERCERTSKRRSEWPCKSMRWFHGHSTHRALLRRSALDLILGFVRTGALYLDRHDRLDSLDFFFRFASFGFRFRLFLFLLQTPLLAILLPFGVEFRAIQQQIAFFVRERPIDALWEDRMRRVKTLCCQIVSFWVLSS